MSVRRDTTNKITCAHCGKRRYGAVYEMEKKSKSNPKA